MGKLIALKPFNNKVFYKNRVFDRKFSLHSPYLIEAKKLLAVHGISINTIDLVKSKTDWDIYLDVPYPWQIALWFRIIMNVRKNILFMIETPVVNPFSHMRFLHLFFPKIFTWNDDLVDNKKYFKFYLPKSSYGLKTQRGPFLKKKFLVMMNANWLPFFPFKILSFRVKELYSERRRAVAFFNKHYPSRFYLYGRGWNKPARFSLKEKLFGFPQYKAYKGAFKSVDKYKILSGFKYALVFENNEIAGYFSEKMVDCFKAKCVPVYLGATNIEKFVPKSCFIDGKNFKSYETLYRYLISINENEYNAYIQNIKNLLQNEKFLDRWFEKGFAKFFLKAISS